MMMGLEMMGGTRGGKRMMEKLERMVQEEELLIWTQ